MDNILKAREAVRWAIQFGSDADIEDAWSDLNAAMNTSEGEELYEQEHPEWSP